jgi:hypothetical protein
MIQMLIIFCVAVIYLLYLCLVVSIMIKIIKNDFIMYAVSTIIGLFPLFIFLSTVADHPEKLEPFFIWLRNL